ncbi:MAG: hypothetical protein II399_08970 [Lachnospiraceae bacterium]|nr:hypothetical protein [Lachnospiraceae bacterium]
MDKNIKRGKLLLRLEGAIVILTILLVVTACILVVIFKDVMSPPKIWNMLGSAVFILICATVVCIKIEQVVGYYKCPHCGYTYVPKYWSVFIAPHIGRKRKMKCPECRTKGWQKKVLTTEIPEEKSTDSE